jgi:hypothetical protein
VTDAEAKAYAKKKYVDLEDTQDCLNYLKAELEDFKDSFRFMEWLIDSLKYQGLNDEPEEEE